MHVLTKQPNIKKRFLEIRKHTESICVSLEKDDFSVQPVAFVSPPKWHLGHTTWFFEQFVLSIYKEGYTLFSDDFAFYFNSYYNSLGDRILRVNRGNMTRPTIDEVLKYRTYVNAHLSEFLSNDVAQEILDSVEIGLQHEQQHQELLMYDIKYIFGNQPAFPTLETDSCLKPEKENGFVDIKEGVYDIGHKEDTFCFDNELGLHKVYLQECKISKNLVTNGDYLEFIEAGGYNNFNLWHADGWDWVQNNKIQAPLYWHKVKDTWKQYTLKGLRILDLNLPVSHVSFYEAWAFAEWKGMRLPTEFEWEIASRNLNYGQLWEWTNSAYLPYPNYQKAEGALGEYNGKFMINTMVMRGASIATPKHHSRPTYRNFFTPETRWQFSGIRLAK
ncbi:ergothioneine biosynthesis protein EgtB [Winogradskyella wandonensis]|uniref:Ergothioneine biosynthesis protein EgtB n=1 Tax=Winogradskyella wandonensis TaxID=1442586 RepID=A0A4R1KLJ4_9FLAO|nr:ergothioneine biosynthesis protein EgtB [Winogradskyella wandonensis]TCK65207.1 ergothioneine biosynthesis protein EgtB [Winogradskyella wandonensis]